MSWRIFLIIAAFNAALIFIVAGLHYGYHHYESPAEEPDVEAIEPWPADVKAQMIESCAEQTIASKEQCACTLDYYEQNASFDLYVEWSAKAFQGHPPGDEKYKVFELGSLHCAETIIVTPTPVTQ